MIKVYHSKHCKPCSQVANLVKAGRYEGEKEVELVDIESDEGFDEFYKHVLEKGDSAVPSAYKDGQQCVISIAKADDGKDVAVFECPGETAG